MVESYTEKELCDMWKRTDGTERAIKVLSELTLLDRKEVKAILKKNGFDPQKDKEKIIESAKKIKNSGMQICFMKHRGLTFKEIGEAMGIPYSTAQNRYTQYRKWIATEERV